VIVTSDASRVGLGAVLQQEHNGALKPVAYASRSLSSAETNYAMIELECLSVVYACEKFKQYLFGRTFNVVTDHKPLIPIFKKPLSKTPLRIQRLLLRLQPFSFTATYQPGQSANHSTADALSRDPLAVPDALDVEDDVDGYVLATMPSDFAEELQNLAAETAADVTLAAVLRYVRDGWPNANDCVAKEYHNIQDELSSYNGCVVKGDRLVIPRSMEKKMLKLLHAGHQGENTTLSLARQYVFWPSMNNHIRQMIKSCGTCAETRRNPAEPLQCEPSPERPWQSVSADFFHFRGKDYLLAVDSFSRFPEVMISNHRAESVITLMKSIFARHGIPEILRTDNGPPFSSREFRQFASDWTFRHVTSSPCYPQGNGLIERHVQTIKQMLQKSADPYEALLNWRATPHSMTRVSPAQALFGRPLRTRLPVIARALRPRILPADDSAKKERMKQDFDQRHRARELPELAPRTRVFVQDLKRWGTIVRLHSSRSYVLRTDSGAFFRRNRRMLTALDDIEDGEAIDDQQPVTINSPPPAAAEQQPRRSTRIRRQTLFYPNVATN
jgi:transposase InsO family protein